MGSLLIILGMTYLCYLAQILVHCCVHRAFFNGSKPWNRRLGRILSISQLQSFLGWRMAHMMHHRFCATARDPHLVDRPLIPYLFTHYPRVAKASWVGLGPFVLENMWVPICFGTIWLGSWSLGYGSTGAHWALLYWILPAVLSHLLVAHFNYWTHVNLGPKRRENTRSGYSGIWRVINKLTLNFYLHAEHHLHPGEIIPRRREGEHFEFPMAGISPTS